MSRNRYPKWWDQTLTIYNKFEDKQTQLVKWYRTVVHNCFWKNVSNKVSFTGMYSTDNITLESNRIVCRIPKDKKFLEKPDWIQVPNDKMGEYFTLGVNDIIIRGEVDDEIDEYRAGYRSTDLLNKYKEFSNCLEIKRCTIDTEGGRGIEHYYVIGE